MRAFQPWRLVTVVVSTITLTLGVAAVGACSPQRSGELAHLQALAAICPTGQPMASFVAADVSDSARSSEVTASRLSAIRSVANQTAACSGQLRVIAFSSSSAAAEVVFDGTLAPPGATEPARLRQVPDLVDGVMKTTTQKLADTTGRLPGDGTDVMAQLGLAKEYGQQLSPGHVLHVVILTDGVASSGMAITNTPEFTTTVATDLAGRVPVPDLTGVSVTVAGIGKVAGVPPPSTYVDALKIFYSAVCGRTKAATCTVVTDLASTGGAP